MSDILKAVLETNLEDEAQADEVLKAAGLSEEAMSAVKGSLRLLTAYKEELPGGILATMADLGGFAVPEKTVEKVVKAKFNPEDEEMKGELEKRVKAAMDEHCSKCDKVKKCDVPKVPIKKADGSLDLSNVPEDMRPTVELIWKEHEEAVQKAAKLEADLHAEQELRETGLYVQKAATFKNLPVKPEEFGPVMQQIAKAAPDAYAKLEPVLKAADEGMATVLKPVGSDSAAKQGSPAWNQIEAKATTLVQKAEKPMTQAAAISEVIRQEPQLYTEYLNEQRKR